MFWLILWLIQQANVAINHRTLVMYIGIECWNLVWWFFGFYFVFCGFTACGFLPCPSLYIWFIFGQLCSQVLNTTCPRAPAEAACDLGAVVLTCEAAMLSYPRGWAGAISALIAAPGCSPAPCQVWNWYSVTEEGDAQSVHLSVGMKGSFLFRHRWVTACVGLKATGEKDFPRK